MQHDHDQALTTPGRPHATNSTLADTSSMVLHDTPSPELISQLKALVDRFNQPNAPLEVFQELLSESLARFLQEPSLHWWCHPDLRPIAIELLHIFSLEENSSLGQFKDLMENMLGACLDCTESYLQDRRVYLTRLRKQYDADVVDIFFNALLEWDCLRLQKRVQVLLHVASTPPIQKRKKITLCEILLDPSLLLMPHYSSRISEPMSALLTQMLQLKRIKIMTVLPGLWLLAMHQDVTIQSWAVFITNLAASGDSLVPERWTGWEQFSTIWQMALPLSDGVRDARVSTTMPLSNDPARIWRAIRTMLSSMGRDVINMAVNYDDKTWKGLQKQLLTSIQDSQTPPAVFLETCRITFHLLGNMKQKFWIIDAQSTLDSLSDAEQILWSVFKHNGTLEYISELSTKERSSKDAASTQALARAYAEYTTWISNFIQSLTGSFDLPNILLSTVRALLTVVNDLLGSKIVCTASAMVMDRDQDGINWEYALEMLNVVFQLLGDKINEGIADSIVDLLSAHWMWLVPISALGPRAMAQINLPPNVEQRISGLATRASSAGKKIALALLDRETEILWRNYATATTTAKAPQIGTLEQTNPLIWLKIAQATSAMNVPDVGDRLDIQGQTQLMEWQTTMVEQFSNLALLPKLETKPSFRPDALDMCNAFNGCLDIVFEANVSLLQGLSSLGEQWLSTMIKDENKRFLVKVLKLWCSPDPDTRTLALFIMRAAWQEVTRSACLRLAFQVGGEKSIQELDNILVDFRNRACPGGATPAVLFELLLDSVTTLFLNNQIDGEGGLYLQIFLDLTSSQEVARHISLIKKLWDSIWTAIKAALFAGRTIWADRQDRGETIRTMTIVANVGLLIIGKIRYFERLLEFEKQGLDTEAQDSVLMDEQGVERLTPTSQKETMPLDTMKAGLERMADWTFAQDTALCTSAIELVCAVLDLLADHSNLIGENINIYLTKIAEGDEKIKSLLTLDQRETLWIALSRHVAYQPSSPQGVSSRERQIPAPKPTLCKDESTQLMVPSAVDTIEISDDDFEDLDHVDLAELDFEDNVQKVVSDRQTSTTSQPTPAPVSTTRSDYVFRLTAHNNPFQSKLNFTSTGPVGGIPAGGSSARRLPPSLSRTGMPAVKTAPKVAPVKKGNKLSQMRSDHRRERSNIVQATKDARQASKLPSIPRPSTSRDSGIQRMDYDSKSESESESDGENNGLSSLIDAEEKWNNRNNNKIQEPRKTKLLDLKDVVGPSKFVDTIAIRRQKIIEDARRQNRLTPNLAALHAQILQWEVSATGDRPPGSRQYSIIPTQFESVDDYVRAFEPLLVLECWQQLMGAREEVNQSSDSVLASFVNRVSIDNFQDTHMRIPLDKASSLMVEDIVVISDPNVKDVFTAVGNVKRPKPFFAKVQAITKAKGQCEVVFRTYLRIEETSPLMFMRPQTMWSVLKMLNLTTTHREYAALTGMRYYDLCEDILSPPDGPLGRPSVNNVQKVMDIYKVNTPQAQAIVAAIEKPKGFTLIQGPPGTGKTKTILGLVGALLADGSRSRTAPVVHSSRSSERVLQTGTVSRILVCAPSNAAIDEIVKRLMGGIRNTAGEIFIPKVVRVGTLETVNMEVKDVALDTLIAKELESSSSHKEEFQSAAQSVASMREKMRQLQDELEKARLELVQAKDANEPMSIANAQSKVKAINKSKWQLGQELDTARSNQAEASQKKDQARKDARNKILGEADVICSTLSASGHDLLTSSTFTFETVIIDEAAQSVEISSLIPLKYGCKRCILVGDPNQLPPTVISQLAAKYAYNQSLFVRIQNLAPRSVHLLSIQYRMHPDISMFPSREFYKSLLKDGPGMAEKTKAEWHSNPITSPYRFFDVYQGQEKIGLSHSQHNPIEAEAAVSLLEGLCNSNPSLNFFRRVGVISPYKQQVRTLKEYFQRVFDKSILDAVDFNTVDGFQGQEKDIIIFSCVRASSRGSVGFLADIRRMNVALTRARQSLFILGHADTLRREEIWGDLVNDAESRGLFTKVTPGLFGQRGMTAPKNILQAKVGVDRRNELYGRVSENTKATVIDRPMATISDIMDVAFYPILPETTASADSKASARNNNRIQHNSRGGQMKEDTLGRDGALQPLKRPEPSRLADAPLSSGKRGPDEMMVTAPAHPTQFNDHSLPLTGEPSPPRPATSNTQDSVSSQFSARAPSPKRAKPTTSLFLKSKPMSMKQSTGPTKKYDVPLRERLASQVTPIRKSYPSGPNPSNQHSSTPSKRTTGPSLDDILGIMKKKPRG